MNAKAVRNPKIDMQKCLPEKRAYMVGWNHAVFAATIADAIMFTASLGYHDRATLAHVRRGYRDGCDVR